MNFIVDLFTGNGIATALIYICITAFVGVLLGKLEFKKVKLGIAGVLFTGIILAHFGARVNADMLHFAQEFGLIIFVYAIGIEVGPRFFGTFRSDGLLLNVFAVSIVAMGFGIALAFHYALDLEPGVITGIFCGAVTNTPALGAAKQVISDYNASNPGGAIDGEILGMGYAVAYPLGVIGIIASMIILKAIFRVKIDKEVDEYTHSVKTGSSHLESVVIKITNSNL
jgi:putative transport protein